MNSAADNPAEDPAEHEPIRLCKDCKWFRPLIYEATSQPYGDPVCDYPGNMPDIVNGGWRKQYSFCQTNRTSATQCGLEARWFAPRS
jgi:hypothetical protein